MDNWIKPIVNRDIPRDEYGSYTHGQPKGEPMQSTAIKQVQQPELYLAADVEPYAKGGWKTTVKASVRVFDGNDTDMYKRLEDMMQMGLAIADETIKSHEQRKAATNE